MKRLITLCIILTAIALISSPAFAEVQNIKVSGDISTGAVYRNNYDLLPATRASSGSTEEGESSDNDNFLYTQARVRVDADLTDNVSATIRYLTEYDWCTESYTSGDGDNVDLDLANVTLKEAFYQPLTLIVGRQELEYGNGFVVADPDTNGTSADSNLTATDMSLRKSFDAIRAIFDYNPYIIEGVFAKIDETHAAENCDEDLFGVNASWDVGNYNAEAEAYWFYNRDQDQDTVSTTDTTSPGHDIHTYGVRGSMTPLTNLNVSGELAFQRGEFETASDKDTSTKRDQAAEAWQIAADYLIEAWEWQPTVRAGWTHYSGESYSNDGDQEAWIPLYEDQTHGVVANYIFSGINGGQNSNADILNIGVTLDTVEDLTMSVDWYQFWLDENIVTSDNTLVTASGTGTGAATGWTNLSETTYAMNADDDLGYEVDVALNYDYTEDVQMGLCAGWFAPGKALEGEYSNNKNDETAVQILATLDVAF